MSTTKNILVVGAGIFGVTTAIYLAKLGYKVEIKERREDILCEASGRNQFRLHVGFHYPRSLTTAMGCKLARDQFVKEYKEAIVTDSSHLYCLSNIDSLVTSSKFLEFCENLGEPYQIVSPSFISNQISLVIEVNENMIDPFVLKDICIKKLKETQVRVTLNTEVTKEEFSRYDQVIICAYSGMNSLLDDPIDLQYEVCEKLVVKLPEIFQNKSIVVLDGSFMCIDPYSTTGFHQIAHVKHMIRDTWVGKDELRTYKWRDMLSKHIVSSSTPYEQLNEYLTSPTQFFPNIGKPQHIGSMFTTRVVLPNLNSTDARPTIVKRINNRVISVFSGKLGNCVQAAYEVGNLLEN